MSTEHMLQRIADALKVSLEMFVKQTTQQDNIDRILRNARELIAGELGVDASEVCVSYRTNSTPPEPKRVPKVGDQTYSLEDGMGNIAIVNEYTVIIYFGSNEEAASVEVSGSELSWNSEYAQWEYGDTEKK